MTSRRKHKKTAQSLGLTERELALAELLDEVLDELRWLQILGYANQYHLNRVGGIDAAERDRILEAATRAVDKDAKVHEWRERLGRVKAGALHVKRAMARARRDQEQGVEPPAPPPAAPRVARARAEGEEGSA
ncbi:MAG: hypothetical protein RL562_2871 [Planctomycetota bacterium]